MSGLRSVDDTAEGVDVQETTERYPALGAEMAVSITRAVTHQRIGMDLVFDSGSLDPGTLSHAVRSSLGAEPLLGCAFTVDGAKAYWSPIADLDAAECFLAAQSTDPESDVDRFQARGVADSGPQVAVALFTAPEADHLAISISHVLADGQAAKQYAYLLADLYTRIAGGVSAEIRPNRTPRPTGKDVWSGLSAAQQREAKRAKSWANPTWSVPARGHTGVGLTYRTAYVEPGLFRRAREYGRTQGATVNDLMLTAVFRACIASFDPPVGKPQSLMCTADLRRYLPQADRLPISQASISGSLDIARVDGECFGDTLARVHGRMAVWAGQCYGAGPFMNAERLTRLGYGMTKTLLGLTFKMAGGSGKTYPWFTNIGILDESRLGFGGSVPTSACTFGPVAIGAAIVPVISTYRDRLAICMGFCADDMDESVVAGVLDATVGELAQAVRGMPSEDPGRSHEPTPQLEDA